MFPSILAGLNVSSRASGFSRRPVASMAAGSPRMWSDHSRVIPAQVTGNRGHSSIATWRTSLSCPNRQKKKGSKRFSSFQVPTLVPKTGSSSVTQESLPESKFTALRVLGIRWVTLDREIRSLKIRVSEFIRGKEKGVEPIYMTFRVTFCVQEKFGLTPFSARVTCKR